MEKNVNVIDEDGNSYEATYPKRAKGLVKNGRARFVDETTICLVCPPDINLEDEKMSENINTAAKEHGKTRYTVEYILEQIEHITQDAGYIRDSLQNLAKMNQESDDEVGPCVTIGSTAAKAKAIEDIVVAREETNQQLIMFYAKVYNDVQKISDR